MIIGIDGNEANEVRQDIGERVGVNDYAYNILWGLYRLRRQKFTDDDFLIYLKSTPRKDMPPQKFFWQYKVIPGGNLWVLRKLMYKLIRGPRPDVLFSPSHYLPPISLCPKVCTIHDLGYLKFSGQFKKRDYWQLKYWSAISIIVSKYIISVSSSTQKDIVRHYPFASKKVEIVSQGYDNNRFNNNISTLVVRRVKNKYILDEYILFLSTLKPSKNIEGLLDAYSLLKKSVFPPHGPKLVIAGKKGWMFESIYAKVNELGLKKDVVFTDFVSESDKVGLIAGAKVFVLPSFWEGFGLDVLHAMACGVPVVVSNVASLPEVAGDAGIYVDPDDTESIARGIMKVLGSDRLEYNNLVLKGLKQVQKFSWEKSALQTLKVLQKAAQ